MANDPVRRLIYFSTASWMMAEVELDELLAECRAINQRLAVTGFLLYGDGSFMQLLEGPPEAVGLVYGRLLLDERHQDVIKMADSIVEARNFSDWFMAYVRLRESEALDGFVEMRKILIGDNGLFGSEALTRYMVETFMRSI